MISRITHQTIQQRTLADLQTNLTAMSKLQSQMSSGKKIEKPSDDPAVASDMLRMRSHQRALAQQDRNIADGDSWLTAVDSALASTISALHDARNLTVQGGDGALGQASRDALAANIEVVRDALLEAANTKYIGRSVFAGTSNSGSAFDGTTYGYTGAVDGAAPPVERRISDTAVVRVDSDGATVFGEGDESVFALLDTIAATLRAGGNPSSHLGDLDVRMEAVLGEVASVGARHARILDARSANADARVAADARLSAIEDIDLAEVIVELQMQEVSYQGALAATAKVLQPTLLDYLR